MSLTHMNASAWTGTIGFYPTIGGFTNYNYTWMAPNSSSTIRFAFLSTSASNYWDLDTVSIKDASEAEQLVNGDFSLTTKTGWNETCQSNCSSIQRYGPLGSYNYWCGCTSSTTYQFLSQTFASVASMQYTITFQIAFYNHGSGGEAAVYVYMN